MEQIPKEIVNNIIQQYEEQIDEKMGHLHNRFVGYISEAHLPIPMVIAVLQLLLSEAVQMANDKWLKGGD